MESDMGEQAQDKAAPSGSSGGAATQPPAGGKGDAGEAGEGRSFLAGGAGATDSKGKAGAQEAGAGKADQGQAAGEARAKSAVPAGEIDIKIPAGVEVDEPLLASFKEIAKKQGWTSESASALVAWYAEQNAKVAQQGLEEWKAQSESWFDELKDDKEIGGAKFVESQAFARKAAVRFGGEAFIHELERYGLQNLPALNRMLVKVGREIGEDDSRKATAGPPDRKNATREERLASYYDHPDSRAARGAK
jgi:hypothetical protein